VHFNYIRNAVEPKAGRRELDRSQHPDAPATLRSPRIGAFMKDTTFSGQTVLFPKPLDMDQGALARAKQPMLQR